MKILTVIVFAVFLFVGMPVVALAQYDDVRWRSYVREAIAKGNIVEALNELEREAAAAEKASDWGKASFFYGQASTATRLSGHVQKGLSYAQKSFDAAEKAKDPWLQSTAISGMINALQSLGKRPEAREWILKGIDNINRIPAGGWRDSSSATFHSYLGRDFLRTNEIQKAIEHLTYAVQTRESLILYLQRVRSHQYVRSNQDALVWDMQGLGLAYQRAKMFEEAIRTYEKSLSIIETNRLQSFRAGSIYDSLGRLYLQRKDPARAEPYFVKAFETASKLQMSGLLVSAAIQLGNLSLQKDKASEAIEYYKQAIARIESSRSQITSEELRKSYFENQGNAYVGIIRASLTAGKPHDAFDYNERARSRAFLDILGTKVQLSRENSLAEEERSLRDTVAALSARLGGQDDSGEQESVDRGQIRRELAAAQKAYDSFLAKVKKENKEQASLMNVEPLTIKQVQEMLDPSVSIIEYFVTQNAVLVWIVEKDNVSSISVPLRRQQLQSKVTSFREAIQQIEEKDKFKRQSEELYKALIQPALPHIRGKELIIIPHDVLHYLPFQALLSPHGKYLIEDFPLNYLSSASLMQFTQEKRKAKGELSSVLAQAGKVLALGNPDLGDPAMSLRFAELEAREVQRLYPQSTVLLKKEATEDKAKGLSPQNDIVHFASHAELSEEDPLASAILLAKSEKEDGRLEVREIFGMDLKASLVVLSACETGLGKLSSGDELVGLTRAFIYAGTPSVMASLWKVEDSSTATLMANFYKNLKTMTKVEALRQAQLELIKGQASSDLLVRRGIGGIGKLGETQQTKSEPASSGPGSVSTSHPYFWAPFILVGEGK